MVAERDQGWSGATGRELGGANDQAGVAWRRLPIGAEPVPGGGVHFRVWAPLHRTVEAVLEAGAGSPGKVELEAEAGGYFAGTAPEARAGTRYRYRLGGAGGAL